MCVIIYKPKNVELSEKYIREGHRVNKHGFGVMYYDSDKKQIVVKKQAEYEIDDVCKLIKELKDKEVVVHFRIMTHGSIKDENCHPFNVLSKDKNAMEMWMMHNGTIHDVKSDIKNDETDSNTWIRTVALPLLREKPGLIRNSVLQKLFKETISNSRLVFMFGAGEVVIINRQGGYERDGCWFSNQSAFPAQSYHSSFWKKKEEEEEDKNICILKIPCSVGDQIHIWRQTDDSYLGQGIIKEMQKSYSLIELTIDNEVKTIQISNYTGESCYHGVGTQFKDTPRYYVLPNEKSNKYEQQSVGDIVKELPEDTECDSIGSCNTDVILLDDKRKEKQEANENTDDDEKKNKQLTTHFYQSM